MGNFLYALIYCFNILLEEIWKNSLNGQMTVIAISHCEQPDVVPQQCIQIFHLRVMFLGSMEFLDPWSLVSVRWRFRCHDLPCQSLSVKSHSCPANSPPRCWWMSCPGYCIPCKFCTIHQQKNTSRAFA